MISIRKNTIRLSGFVALFCLSLACFTYINSIDFKTTNPTEHIYVEELNPSDSDPEILPDVDLIKRIVRKAFEFMTYTSF